MTDAHNPRVLSDADSAADLAGLPRPVSFDDAMAMQFKMSVMDCDSLEDEFECIAAAKMLIDLVSERDALSVRVMELERALRDAPQRAEPCFCDRNNLGEPGVSCGDCPTRDYRQAPSAPQQAEGWVMVPVEPTREMIDAYLKGTASGFYSARSDWANMLAARPSAPTAKPLFGEMIAQHPGLREEIAAESERADFEAAYRARYPVSCDLDPAKFNRSGEGDYEDIRVSIAWAMWQARASKGTP